MFSCTFTYIKSALIQVQLQQQLRLQLRLFQWLKFFKLI